MNIITLAYFGGGLVVWKIRKELLPIYCIYLTTFGLLLLEAVSPSLDGQTLLETSAINAHISSYLLLLCTVINFVKNPNKKSFLNATCKFWCWFILGTIYFFVWMGLHGRNTGISVSRTFLCVSILPVYYRSIAGYINVSQYKKHFIIICIIETLFVILNLLGIPIYAAQVLERREFLIAGSFNRYNTLASFVGMIGVILSYAYFYKQLKGKFYAYLMVPIFICMLMTGARMQLVWMCFAVFMVAFSNFKSNKKLCLTMFMGVIAIFIFLQTFNLRGYSSADAESGIQRQFYGIVSAINRSSAESGEQTQDASFYMIEHYFSRSPIIGNGIGNREYSYHPTIPSNLMMGDAAFAFILVEYGILGFIFAMLIISSAFTIMKKGMSAAIRKKSNILFASLFVITLTESGLFDIMLMMYVWTFMAYLKYQQKTLPL